MDLDLIVNIILAVFAIFGSIFTIYQEIRHQKNKTISEIEKDLENYIQMINNALIQIKRLHLKK